MCYNVIIALHVHVYRAAVVTTFVCTLPPNPSPSPPPSPSHCFLALPSLPTIPPHLFLSSILHSTPPVPPLFTLACFPPSLSLPLLPLSSSFCPSHLSVLVGLVSSGIIPVILVGLSFCLQICVPVVNRWIVSHG